MRFLVFTLQLTAILGHPRRPYIVFRNRFLYGFMLVCIYIYIYTTIIIQIKDKLLYENKNKLLNTQTPVLRLRHYLLHLAVESDLYFWPGTRSSAEYCSGVSSLNGDPNLLQKMAEGKGFTRTGPETTTKLLEKGEGFRTKHTGGLNANGDEMVCGLQIRILGLLLLFCLLCHQSRLSGS